MRGLNENIITKLPRIKPETLEALNIFSVSSNVKRKKKLLMN